MKIFLLTACILVFMKVSAQSFTTKIGMGIGGKFEKDFPGCSQKSNSGRIMGSVSQYYAPTINYSIGLQAITSGKLFSMIGGSASSCEIYDDVNDKIIIGYNNLNASSYFLRNRYRFKESNNSFYADLGLGITNYYYGAITGDNRRAKKISFAISPQIGFQFSRFDLGCLFILGGQTPAYEGYNSFRQKNVSLTSIKSQQLYITFSYDVLKF